MNAAEQAKTLEQTSKIAAVVNLFKLEFPDARVDLKPWANDPDTRSLMDPDSIDIGFHFPGRSHAFQCRSILVQIRFHQDDLTQNWRAIGIELLGFDHQGEQWRLSTIAQWQFLGKIHPSPDAGDRLKQFCHQILVLFNTPDQDREP